MALLYTQLPIEIQIETNTTSVPDPNLHNTNPQLPSKNSWDHYFAFNKKTWFIPPSILWHKIHEQFKNLSLRKSWSSFAAPSSSINLSPFLIVLSILTVIFCLLEIELIIKLLLFITTAASNLRYAPTRKLTLILLPLVSWLLLFLNAKYIPDDIRPDIEESFLPMADNILFGDVLSISATSCLLAGIGLISTWDWRICLLFSAIPSALKLLDLTATTYYAVADILGFLAYGVFHYISPVIFLLWTWKLANYRVMSIFTICFGSQNLAGVITQLVWPNVPPCKPTLLFLFLFLILFFFLSLSLLSFSLLLTYTIYEQ